MPSPTQSDLHVNVPLTNVSIAYLQSASTYIADKVFPKVPVDKQSDLYWKYSKSDWRRSDVKRRAPSTESPGVGWSQDMGQYFCHVYAVHKDIDDQLRANADSPFNMDRDATEFITNQLLLQRDIDWNAQYFKDGVWDTNMTGTTDFVKWSDAGSDPISDVADLVVQFRKLTGFKPNICVLGADVMKVLKQHPDIIDRIKYTQRGVVTVDLLESLFDIPKIYVSLASEVVDPARINDAVAQDAAATYQFLADTKSGLIGYAPKSASIMTPSAGYTFVWSGYHGGNSEGVRMKQFRMDPIASDRLEGEMTYDMKVVADDMGIFLNEVIA